MMKLIKRMYQALLDNGDSPDTAIMNYETYRKLIFELGGTKTHISPLGIYLSSERKLDVEIFDTLDDDEIIVCTRDKFDWNLVHR